MEKIERPVPAPDPLNRGEKIRGWKALAARLGISEDTARAYARLADDPLPIRTNTHSHAEPWCWSLYLDEWKARRCGGILPDGTELEIVVGWPAICFLFDNAPVDTVRRWSRRPHDPLPVIRRGRALPWAYAAAIRDWRQRGDVPFVHHDGEETENPRKPRSWVPTRPIAVAVPAISQSAAPDQKPSRSYVILKRPAPAASRRPTEKNSASSPNLGEPRPPTAQATSPQ